MSPAMIEELQLQIFPFVDKPFLMSFLFILGVNVGMSIPTTIYDKTHVNSDLFEGIHNSLLIFGAGLLIIPFIHVAAQALSSRKAAAPISTFLFGVCMGIALQAVGDYKKAREFEEEQDKLYNHVVSAQEELEKDPKYVKLIERVRDDWMKQQAETEQYDDDEKNGLPIFKR